MAHRARRQKVASESGLRIEIRGVVQGVGFRPFVYRLAHTYALRGWVRNTSWGVEIELEGTPEALARLVASLRTEAPPIARIESLTTQPIPPNGHERFEILGSTAQRGAYQLVSPDMATCADCTGELFAPQNRRHRYPFTNCTNCGPRFTIIENVPYDRRLTTMRAFQMCPDCQREYDDPLDRRFHAQPNACPVCGPQLRLLDRAGQALSERDDALLQTADLLRSGQIVAIKGLGGFQLACDATNADAVARLRERKRRRHKPFAVMVGDLAAAERHAVLACAESELLASPAAPIVLVPWRETSIIATEVAPGTRVIGVMLPYTPLHHLLLHDANLPLVMTSGNLSEEPIARDNDEALERLGSIADCFLVHNRDIYSRYDDSVWFVPATGAQPIRRARGYAPTPIRVPFKGRSILACGAELKNSFCLTRDEYAFLSQHIGDMANLETLEHFQQTSLLYRQLFHIEPEIVATDMHPDYMATRYGLGQPGVQVRVQHHHAHLAACLADDGIEGPAIGVIMDGTGYGLDGGIWGGEFLIGDARGFQRAAHLAYLPLPGGDQAIRRPYRISLAYLQALGLEDRLPAPLRAISEEERDAVKTIVARGLNCVQTSSAGRLFDAISSMLGICHEASYEAQAAIELETLAETYRGEGGGYPYESRDSAGVQSWGKTSRALATTRLLEVSPLIEGILGDQADGVPTAEIAWRFHHTVADMIHDTCVYLRDQTGLNHVALSGGCFQNRLLLSLTVPILKDDAFEVLLHRQTPCNDGAIALGQAIVAHYAVDGE